MEVDSADSDITGSEDEYNENEKKLLQQIRKHKIPSNSKNSVYGLVSDSDDEEEVDYGLPDIRAWGKEKRHFYSGDNEERKSKDTNTADLEEQEAKELQRQLFEQFDDEDLLLDITQKVHDDKKITEEIIATDTSGLSKAEKIKLLEIQASEFFKITEDFKNKMHTVKNLLDQEGIFSEFHTFYKNLVFNYGLNIYIYLLLKTSNINVQNHPVIKRLYQYRQLFLYIKPIYENEKLNVSNGIKDKQKLKKNNVDDFIKVRSNEGVKNKSNNFAKPEILPNNEEYKDETDKRGITYQIAKNKGLVPRRKKELRNPRVKHRNKYEKAKIRRKGAIREHKPEISRYGGEISGIKASVTKSVKIK